MQYSPLSLFLLFCFFATSLHAQSVTDKKVTRNLDTIYAVNNIPPVIGAWFWGEKEFELGGYKQFIDQVAQYSCYNVLSTAIRVAGRDITDIDVYKQVKLANEYAKEKGIQLALELDPRVARRKFEELYPYELQESLWLKEVEISGNAPVETAIQSINLVDHMIGSKTPFISLKGSLRRVYVYNKTPEGIYPLSISDITENCSVTISSKDSIVVRVPAVANNKSNACVMVAFTHLTPDIFAPHLIEFTRNIIRAYSDIPLTGVMRDEWGFPPSTPAERMAMGNHFWYSKYYAAAYAEKTGGRELLEDCLLMYMGINGKQSERIKAINSYMELNWQRNKELENYFYQTVKQVFGTQTMVASHPTWYPYPNKLESKKNGLFWWVAKRDWAQTDEVTPIAVRTALAKKWDSPVWYNQYYSTNSGDYEHELWSSVLAGGRINYHPLFPSRKKNEDTYLELFQGNLMKGESRVRLLNYITKSPVYCPVAVIFGHAATMNWTYSGFEDVGMDLVNELWAKGIYTDLIPASEIENGNLSIDQDGYISYGKQQYASVILYNPEFEKISTNIFFNDAAKGKTTLFRIGSWTKDFDGNHFDGNAALPVKMKVEEKKISLAEKIATGLKKNHIYFQTPAIRLLEGYGYTSNVLPTTGYSQLIDGTFIQIAGTKDVAGDIINSTVKIGKHNISFDAIGVAAVRLDDKGQVEALAAGGAKIF